MTERAPDSATAPLAIQAPVSTAATVELARDSRIFRKQVLRTGTIRYKGQPLAFSDSYLDGLAAAFADKPYPTVPLMFAPSDNSHTQDVERIRGEVIGLERTPDGLDAVVRAANDDAARLLRENPNICCSVRIEQPLQRADGRSWPAAMQHLLVTANPVMPGLSPWQSVDLAAEGRTVIDMSSADLSLLTSLPGAEIPTAPGAPTPPPPAVDLATLTPTEASMTTPTQNTDPVEGAAQIDPTLLAALTQIGPDGLGTLKAILDQAGEPSQEEIDEIARQMEADEAATSGAPEVIAAAAAPDARTVELSRQVDAQAVELSALRTRIAVTDYEALRTRLADDAGIPPYIVDLARPLLAPNSIELAVGQTVDAGQIVRDVLTAVGKHVRLVDLSRGDTVYDTPADDDAMAAAAAQDTANAEYLRANGLL